MLSFICNASQNFITFFTLYHNFGLEKMIVKFFFKNQEFKLNGNQAGLNSRANLLNNYPSD